MKSSLCPVLVQAMPNVCPKEDLLQGLSSRCLTPVKSLSNLWHLGQTLDIYPVLVHSPSIGNHNCQSWTKSGQTCNLDIVRTRLGFINLKGGSSSEVLDKLWTDLVPRQTLDKVYISLQYSIYRQILDICWTSTICGLILDLLPPREEIPVKSCMKS